MRNISNYNDAKEVLLRNSGKDFKRYHMFGSDVIVYVSKSDVEVLFLDLPEDMLLPHNIKEEIIKRHRTFLREDELEYSEPKLRELERDWNRETLEQITRKYPRVLDSELTFVGEAISLILEYPFDIEDEDDEMESLRTEVFNHKNDIRFRKLFS